MSKKKKIDPKDQDDIRGFEEFIESENDKSFLFKRINVIDKKNDKGFEFVTFLTNDSIRIQKLKNLLSEKIPFSLKFSQTNSLIEIIDTEASKAKEDLYKICDEEKSYYRNSLRSVFNNLFKKI